MAVNLSPVAGAAAQFLDNSGNVLTGGKLFTYAAGTTTPQASYTSGLGITFHSNPIILDAAGRVPAGGEIWLTDGLQYKFVLTDANDVLIGTWDNLIGINSNFLNYYTQEEIQTATAGQTVFTLSTITYSPGTNSLSVFVDGVNQYDGSSFAYVETDSTTVTFTSGLHVGALVKFTTAVSLSSGVNNASLVTYDPPFIGGVSTTVEAKLAQTVSVIDFGAIGDGVTDDTAAIQAALDSGAGAIYFPEEYIFLTETVSVPSNRMLHGRGTLKLKQNTNKWIIENKDLSTGNTNIRIYDLTLDGNKDNQSGSSLLYGVYFSRVTDSIIEGLKINNCKEDAILLGSSGINEKCERVKVFKNICTNNSRNGISIVAGDFCEVRLNTIVGCAGTSLTENAGIDIEADNANVSVSYNDVTDNVVMNVGSVAKAGRGIICVNAVSGTMTDNNISQNRIYNCGSFGIELQDLSFVTANNNDISNCGIDVGQTTSGIYVLNCDDSSLNDNRIRFQGNLTVLGGAGIFINASDRATINSNKCISNYGNGIEIRGSRQGTCNDNLIANSGVGGTSGLGINLQTASGIVPSGWVISGNRCYDSAGASGSQAYGIYLTNAESCNINDNIIFGNRTAGMVESGTTNSIRSNFGYDPLGYWATPPAIPASLSSATNTSNHPCFVVIEGGTDVNTLVGGTSVTALAVASPLTVLVEPGQTIGLIYTIAPTWRWFRR